MQSTNIYEPLAVFEHLQPLNWAGSASIPSRYDIAQAISETHDWIYGKSKVQAFTLSVNSICEIHDHLAQSLNINSENIFVEMSSWSAFLGQMVGSDDKLLNAKNVSGSEAWLISQLFWNHLQSLRLAVPWLFISALDLQNNGHGFGISLDKIGLLMTHLSSAGPSIYDAENLRANIRKYI